MTFLSVLIALIVEHLVESRRPGRRHAWFDSYCQRLSRSTLAQGLLRRPWGALAALLPVLLVVGWLQALFNDLGSVFALLYGSAVLLYSLGPRNLAEETEGFVEARDSGQYDRATALAQGFCLSEIPDTEPRRSFAVARAVVVLANRRLIAPLFWFVVFGAVGAAAYRAVQLLAERLQAEDCPEEMKRYSDEARHVADWAPARITAIGYAVAGNFDAVAHAWRSFDYGPSDGPLTEADQLLANTGLAALDTFPDDVEELAAGDEPMGDAGIPPVVEDALALVWRCLALWVTVVGGGSLVAALS
ncbi:MAG: regulatory signaling modulator protein AmpE [Chromatiaceae bacterium]|nr:regulatory signaling modulator protein AmpE [Chromatiaceae bacterium]MCP5421963.1 regulatory signaling modulator protein AmpE [Chromatiaceae bacterium]